MEKATFDQYANDYNDALAHGIKLSGENGAYFAQRRVEWMGRRLDALGVVPRRLMDFGCGTGSATPFLLNLPHAETLLGIDVSSRLLEVAQSEHGSQRARFMLADQYPDGGIDVLYCNGVFHHIPPAERATAIDYMWRVLRPGGLVALWENNPWNPGTRLVMRRIPFDRDAVLVSPSNARSLLRRRGFTIAGTEFLFIFPRPLKFLRGLEPPLARYPLGAQYVVLARKPHSPSDRPGRTGSH
jgi:ubiquinone/menaquinone biosynthesis C-methylase UbiE